MQIAFRSELTLSETMRLLARSGDLLAKFLGLLAKFK